jgi:protein-tyrosine-phosphatase
MQVHFICRGNVFRSLIAEAYLNSLNISGIKVISSGIVAKEYGESNIPVIKFTLDFLKQKSLEKYAKTNWDQLTQKRICKEDINICMNQRVYDECKGHILLPKNTVIWDIDDTGETKPIPTTKKELLEQTEHIYQKIKNRVDKLVKVTIKSSKL